MILHQRISVWLKTVKFTRRGHCLYFLTDFTFSHFSLSFFFLLQEMRLFLVTKYVSYISYCCNRIYLKKQPREEGLFWKAENDSSRLRNSWLYCIAQRKAERLTLVFRPLLNSVQNHSPQNGAAQSQGGSSHLLISIYNPECILKDNLEGWFSQILNSMMTV